jgi:RNA polymerase sigma-70 factor (ECF subfamily)
LSDFEHTLAEHRPDLLRHCYRMLGSFADAEDVVQDVLVSAWKARDSYAGTAPLGHWLMRIATNACLNELARRQRRGLPQLDHAAAREVGAMVESDRAVWLTPAPDSQLLSGPVRTLELRESVALAFLALLQHLPARQRAVLLLKDVVGWSSEEIAVALEMSVSSVSSALHRARETVSAGPTRAAAEEPAPDIVRAYIRSWEEHDVESLVALLHDDVVLAMPPHATWFQGTSSVERFLRAPLFSSRWAAGFRIVPTRANGQLALAFYRHADGAWQHSSLQLLQSSGGRVREVIVFVGADYLHGFEVPMTLAAP